MFASVMRSRYKQRPKESDAEPELDGALEKIAQLEERIRVLERIITENQYDLRKEIDSL
jgi:hypothetical protein